VSETLLSVDGLAVAIGNLEIVSNVDFQLRRGECLGLVGETGSGKSVTCRALMGLLGRIGGRVTRGEVLFDGLDLASISERHWRSLRGRHIGFIPQSSLSGLDPVMTVGRQLVETIRHLRGGGGGRAAALELLEQVQMPHARDALDSYPHQLSGGMRQRVMIALGIAGRPDILVADEPTTALDVTVQREILDLLADLQAQSQMALILVTHDLGVVSAVSDQVAIMYAGATVEAGATTDVLERPAHPYTEALLAARPSLLGVGHRLSAIRGYPPDPREWPPGCRFAPRCPRAIPDCDARLPAVRVLETSQRVRCIRASGQLMHAVEEWVR
jgi:oligopeptide/dipeptide ABC transporter ATP-binding protein